MNERALFSLSVRDLGRAFSELELSYRPLELRSRIEQAYAEHRTVLLPQVERRFGDADVQYLDVHIAPLQNNGGNPLGVLISFADATRYRQMQEEIQRTKQDLGTAYEELQSTNEELETMNEELQSTNEEMEATNTELQLGTTQLDDLNAFLQSALDGTGDSVIILDHQTNVVLWNRRSENLWGLRADEVRGRPFFQLDIGLPVSRLAAPIQECLRNTCGGQPILLDGTSRRGKPIQCEVRLSPLVGPRGEPRGAVVLVETSEPSPA